MAGSNPFLIEETGKFKRSFKQIASSTLKNELAKYFKDLTLNPYPTNSREEPKPGGYSIPPNWTFHKLAFKIGRGASGQIRLMYLVNEKERIIKPVWIYNHEQFPKRPSEKELKNILKDIL